MKHWVLPTVDSTNTWVKEHAPELSHGDYATAFSQVAGRGQRGNKWESEPGKNLTYSGLLRPMWIKPAGQFLISQAVALATLTVVKEILASSDIDASRAKIKWPNDIYVDDRKIAGILIEHSIREGQIAYTVCGVGLNVNQREFRSDAPNPISLWQLIAEECDVAVLAESLNKKIVDFAAADNVNGLHDQFLGSLWRKDGQLHLFRMADGTYFRARINTVYPDGMLELEYSDGSRRSFAFKELQFVI